MRVTLATDPAGQDRIDLERIEYLTLLGMMQAVADVDPDKSLGALANLIIDLPTDAERHAVYRVSEQMREWFFASVNNHSTTRPVPFRNGRNSTRRVIQNGDPKPD